MRWYLGKCLWFAKWKRLYNSSYTKDYDHITMWLPLDTNWYWIYKNENLYVEIWKYVCFLLLKNVLTLLYVSFTFLKRWLKSHKGPPEGPHPGVSSEHVWEMAAVRHASMRWEAPLSRHAGDWNSTGQRHRNPDHHHFGHKPTGTTPEAPGKQKLGLEGAGPRLNRNILYVYKNKALKITQSTKCLFIYFS